MINLLKAVAQSKTEAPKDAVPQQAEALGGDVSIDEAASLRFLDDIKLLVSQAVALWPRAAVGKIHLSTASTSLFFLPFVEYLLKPAANASHCQY